MSVNFIPSGPGTFARRIIYICLLLGSAAVSVLVGGWMWLLLVLVCVGVVINYLTAYQTHSAFEQNLKAREELLARLRIFVEVITNATESQKEIIRAQFGRSVQYWRDRGADHRTLFVGDLTGFRQSFIAEVTITQLVVTYCVVRNDPHRVLSEADAVASAASRWRYEIAPSMLCQAVSCTPPLPVQPSSTSINGTIASMVIRQK